MRQLNVQLAALAGTAAALVALYAWVSGKKDLREAIADEETLREGMSENEPDAFEGADVVSEVATMAPLGRDDSLSAVVPHDACGIVLESWPDIECARAAYGATKGTCVVPLGAMPAIYAVCTQQEEADGRCQRPKAIPFGATEATTAHFVIAAWCEQLRSSTPG